MTAETECSICERFSYTLEDAGRRLRTAHFKKIIKKAKREAKSNNPSNTKVSLCYKAIMCKVHLLSFGDGGKSLNAHISSNSCSFQDTHRATVAPKDECLTAELSERDKQLSCSQYSRITVCFEKKITRALVYGALLAFINPFMMLYFHRA